MKGINTTILILLAGLLTGILCESYLPISHKALLIFLSGILVLYTTVHFILKLRRGQHPITGILAFLLFMFLGVTVTQFNDPLKKTNHYTQVTSANSSQHLILTIVEELKPGFYDAKYIARLNQTDSIFTTGLVLLNITKDSTVQRSKLKVDDRIYVNQKLEKLTPARNPYQFDYAAYLNGKNIYAQITTSSKDLVNLKKQVKTLKGYAAKSRSHLQQKINSYSFNKDSRAVLNALLLGQRQELSSDLQESYSNVGVIHILAVSGLHVGILMLLVQFLLKPLGNFKTSRILRCILVIAIIWAFALFTGSSPSVLRAATMFSFIQLGLLLGQRQASLNAIIISAFLLILINPGLIYEVGFQLSYAAVFFIIWLYPKFEMLWEPKNKILKYYWQLIVVSIAAQIGVLPLSLYYFHQFPGLFLVANMIILPVLGILLIFGIVILILAGLNMLPAHVASAYDFLLTLLNTVIRYLAQFDSFLITNIYFSITLVFIGYAIIFSFGNLINKISYTRICIFLITLIALPTGILVLRKQQSNSSLYVLHQYNTSLLAKQDSSKKLIFYLPENKNISKSIVRNFKENQFINSIQNKPLKNFYLANTKKILRIDSLGVYDIPGLKPDYIILSQSPRINLDRLIHQFPEVKIIADGSNYKSYVMRWEATCRKKKIPFHNTYEMGFYKIE
ncbi:ComEC/Rec2 family competence protein [Leeuwenhoekiella sp. W20_SRS_FM14]|uniref:ComEC/Rec2 family competence protein n=1 Tax=Leeuwenhoekiella sp. W20_SRS_FM14 TaxID=3240270 RepID=UPI003F9CBE20